MVHRGTVRGIKKLPSTGVRMPVDQPVRTRTYARMYARACTHTYYYRNPSYLHGRTEKYNCALKCQSQECLKLIRKYKTLFLADVVHVVICRKIRTHQTVTARS